MKPIKLIISAFGPYSGKMPEINFEQFDEKGLFLISGDTGAGKTTIFDAICFALFGTTSGSYKEKKNHLRSEYADDSVESYVDFYFSHQGKNYHILRKPSFDRINRNGNVTTEAEKVIFYYPDGTSVEGVSKVDTKKDTPGVVEELLHVNAKQFKQIAMIAQGEFWELLNAKTEERTEILRTIFMTGGYKNIEFKLKERVDNSKGTKERFENSIIQYFGDVECEESDDTYERLTQLQERAKLSGSTWNLEEMIGAIDDINKSDNAKLKTIESELKKAEAELKTNTDLLATARTNNEFISRLAELKEEKKTLDGRKQDIDNITKLLGRQKAATREVNPSYIAWKRKCEEVSGTVNSIEDKQSQQKLAIEVAKNSQERLSKAEREKDKADTLQRQIDKINEEEPKYQQRIELNEKLAQIEKLSIEISNEETAIEEAEINLKNRIDELKKTIANLKNKPAEATSQKALLEKLRSLMDTVESIVDVKIPEKEERLCLLSDKQKAFIVMRDKYVEIHEKRAEAERILENSRAGILATKLVEGQKCPVCGSIHHPEPAMLPEESISEEEFKKYQEQETIALENKNKANTEAEKAKLSYDEYVDQLKDIMISCLGNEFIGIDALNLSMDELEESIVSSRTNLEIKIENGIKLLNVIEGDCKLLEASESELEAAQGKEFDDINSGKASIENRKHDNQVAKTETTALLKGLKELSFENWETALSTRDNAEETLKAITDEINSATDSKNKADMELAAIKAALQTLEKSLEDQKENEKLLKTSLDDNLKEQKFESIEEMLSFVVSESNITDYESTVSEYNQAVATNKIQLEQAEKDSKGRAFVDIGELQLNCDKQSEAVEDIRRSHNRVENRIKGNSEKKANIVSKREDLEKAHKEYHIADRLYKLVKGMTGNGKLTLEQYIQAAGFDGIIAAANRRLYPMSDGQYELYRKSDSLSKSSSNFLDLEVLDNYTGRRRPVVNLSGGESFKASLCLALGLSDTVSSNLGGVQMDALFIDEGFGTLDRKSIDNAMEILINLSEANKLVGIISHREELKDNIQQQIQIKKTKNGSNFSIVKDA